MPIRWARDDADLQGAIAVRERVFIDEQGLPAEEELDGRDGEALHLVALDTGAERVVAPLRLLLDGQTAKAGRAAVDRASRRPGIAARMLAAPSGRAGGRAP